MNLFVKMLSNPFYLPNTASEIRGLCGNRDSNPYNDLVGPDGAQYSDETRFGYAWQLNESAGDSSHWDYTKSNFFRDDVLDERFRPLQTGRYFQKRLVSVDTAKDICSRNALSGSLLNACVLDVIASGDASLANATLYIADMCSSQCSFKGICVGVEVCSCFEGWTGVDCSQPICKYECGSHGSCLNGVCQCEHGWQGDTCATSVSCNLVNNCTDINHGLCVATNKCQCFTGYTGADCNSTVSCASLSDCSSNFNLRQI